MYTLLKEGVIFKAETIQDLMDIHYYYFRREKRVYLR